MYQIEMMYFTATEEELDDVGMNVYECWQHSHKDAKTLTVATGDNLDSLGQMFTLFGNVAVGMDHGRLFECQCFVLKQDNKELDLSAGNKQRLYYKGAQT